MIMRRTPTSSPRAALAALTCALAQAPATAASLVEFTFGTGVGTDTAQLVAEHLNTTPVVGKNRTGAAAPHTFIDLGDGNMAMQLALADGGYWYDFTITADPGYTFQINDAHFAFTTRNTAGVGRTIRVWPNDEPSVLWYNAAGGDTSFTDMGPGGFGWKAQYWDPFITRTDLRTLRVQLVLGGNSGGSLAIFDRVLLEGNVIPVPEPSSALLMLLGAAALLTARRVKATATSSPA